MKTFFLENRINLFHLIGPETCRKVYQLIEKLESDKSKFEKLAEQNELVSAMGILQDPGSFPRNFVLPIKLKVADNKRYIDTSINFRKKTLEIG